MKSTHKKLRVSWTKREKDLMYNSPNQYDGHLMHTFISHTPLTNGKTLREELEERGYDITTLKFSIERKEG